MDMDMEIFTLMVSCFAIGLSTLWFKIPGLVCALVGQFAFYYWLAPNFFK